MGKFLRRISLTFLMLVSTTSISAVHSVGAQEICDPTIDPMCGESFDPTLCDPWVDPWCDPDYDPAYGDPYLDPSFCDPWVDSPCEPAYEPGYDQFCDPWADATCDLGPCDLTMEQFCEPSTDPLVYVPPSLAFVDPTSTIKTVLSRSDTSDDVAPSRVPDSEVALVAASRMILSIDALAELGGFIRTADPETNALVRTVREQVPSDGLTDEGYRSELESLADDLPEFVDQLETGGNAVSDELVDVIDSLDAQTLASLANGETSLIDPRSWIAGLADLSVRNGQGPDDPTDRAEDITAVLGLTELFTAPPETEGLASEENTSSDEELDAQITQAIAADSPAVIAAPEVQTSAPAEGQPGDPLPLSVIIALVGAAVAVIGSVVAFARRRSVSSSPQGSLDSTGKLSVTDLLDASRRMTASLDTQDISAIALSETRQLVNSEAGLIVAREGNDLVAVHCDRPELFRLDALHGSSLRRVIETGQSIATVASDESVLVEVPMAMAAVPVVADGTVTGAIMVVRIASEPFARPDIEALDMLAPLVGSAFQAAKTHGSATALNEVEPMTGLKNRRRLDMDLAATGGTQVAYIMIDVDHFKNFNDVNGHAAGDQALRLVAKSLSNSVRPGDVVYRYGGEEFCVLLPDATNEDARAVAERARAAVEACEIPGEENQPNGTVTVSIGVADTSSRSVADLVERADAALYEAKHSGRNRVRVDATSDD